MADCARQILTFEAAGALYGVDAARVSEVTGALAVTRVPQAPAALRGVANVRGEVLPILSAPVLLGQPTGGAETRVIVLVGRSPVGLSVDRIGAMHGARNGDAVATFETAEGPVRLLDVDALVANAFADVAAGRANNGAARGRGTGGAEIGAEPDLAFLELQLAGQHYALKLEQISSVSALPAEVTRPPHSDAVAEGMISTPQGVLPLVSLAALLGLPKLQSLAGSQVVEVRLGTHRIGLVVDQVRSVLRARPGDVGTVPALLNRGAGEARIEAILKSASGLVSILAVEKIFADTTVAALLADTASTEEETSIVTDDEGVEQVVLFRLGEETYGLPVAAVEEVVRLPATLTRVPKSPAFIAGVMDHRGAVVPLIDQRRRFGVGDDAALLQRKVIVTRVGDGLTGFIVDAIEDVLTVPAAALRASPDLAAGDVAVFDRVAMLDHGGRMVLLVDPRQLLDQVERDLVQALAAESEPAPS